MLLEFSEKSPGICIIPTSALNRCVSTPTSVDFALLPNMLAVTLSRRIFQNSYKTRFPGVASCLQDLPVLRRQRNGVKGGGGDRLIKAGMCVCVCRMRAKRPIAFIPVRHRIVSYRGIRRAMRVSQSTEQMPCGTMLNARLDNGHRRIAD